MSTCCRCDDAMLPLGGIAGRLQISGLFFGVYKVPGILLDTSFAIDVVGGRCCFAFGGFALLLLWIFADFLDCVCCGFLLSHFTGQLSRIHFGLYLEVGVVLMFWVGTPTVSAFTLFVITAVTVIVCSCILGIYVKLFYIIFLEFE